VSHFLTLFKPKRAIILLQKCGAVDESLQGVSLSEAGYAAFVMFMSAPSDVGRYASVENAVGAVRHDVNPAAGHLRILAWMAGSSPAMTVEGSGHDD
jgi:hypothetical protein